MADEKKKPILDLPTEYAPIAQGSTVVWKPGYTGRFINPDMADYWHGKGLRPVTKAIAPLVMDNPLAFQENAAGRLRSGSQELWVEDLRNNAGRQREKEQARIEQIKLTQAMQELQDTAAANGVEVQKNPHTDGVRFENTLLGTSVVPTPSPAAATASENLEVPTAPVTAFADV